MEQNISTRNIFKTLAAVCTAILVIAVLFFIATRPYHRWGGHYYSGEIVRTSEMGVLHYPFWGMMIPLGFGNAVFNVSLAFLAAYAYGLLQSLPFF